MDFSSRNGRLEMATLITERYTPLLHSACIYTKVFQLSIESNKEMLLLLEVGSVGD